MTIKLILAKTNYDAITAWTDIKTVEVNLPLGSQDGWNVIGADWEYDIEHSKRQQERIEANRLIDALEQEIDKQTGQSRLQRREVSDYPDNYLPLLEKHKELFVWNGRSWTHV